MANSGRRRFSGWVDGLQGELPMLTHTLGLLGMSGCGKFKLRLVDGLGGHGHEIVWWYSNYANVAISRNSKLEQSPSRNCRCQGQTLLGDELNYPCKLKDFHINHPKETEMFKYDDIFFQNQRRG